MDGHLAFGWRGDLLAATRVSTANYQCLAVSTIAVMPGDASFYASGTWQATWSHNKIE